MLRCVAHEHASPGEGTSPGVHRHDGYHSGASTRGIQRGGGDEGGIYRAHSQSSQRGPYTERGGHKGYAGFDPGRPVVKNRSHGSCHHGESRLSFIARNGLFFIAHDNVEHTERFFKILRNRSIWLEKMCFKIKIIAEIS